MAIGIFKSLGGLSFDYVFTYENIRDFSLKSLGLSVNCWNVWGFLLRCWMTIRIFKRLGAPFIKSMDGDIIAKSKVLFTKLSPLT